MILNIDGKEVVVSGYDIYKRIYKVPEGVKAVVIKVEDTDIISGKLIIPDGVVEIAKGAVDHLADYIDPITGKTEKRYSIDEIKYLSVPKSVKKVDELEFDRCDSLREILVPAESEAANALRRYSWADGRGHKRRVVTEKEKNSEFISETIFRFPDTPGNLVYLTPDGEGVRKKTEDGMLHISSADGNYMGIYQAAETFDWGSQRPWETFINSVPRRFNGYIVSYDRQYIDLMSKYIKDNPDKELEVSFIAVKDYRGLSKSPEIEYREQRVLPDALYAGNGSLRRLTIGTGVRKIGRYSFSDCKKLESLIISNGVEIIGDSSFRGCEKLEEVYLPETLKQIGKNAFQDCIGLRKITIPAGIKKFDVGVFKNCINLEEIEIPEGVQVIGDSAFENCRKLKITRIPSTVVSIGYSAFEGCESIEAIRLPQCLRKLCWTAFKDCIGLEDLTINSNLQEIEYASFMGCSKLSSVVFEDEKNSRLRKVGGRAFEGCTSLEVICLPNNGEKQEIEDGAFASSGLKEIDMSLVSKIKSGAFADCKNLREFKVGDNLYSILDDAFRGCSGLEGQMTIGENISYLGSSVFEGCSGITGVEIRSDKIKHINYNTFLGCSLLVSVVLPNQIETIGERAFGGCTSLQEIQIPSSVTEIYHNAFEECDKLSMVDIPKDGKLKEIKDEAFKGCVSLESMHLPDSIDSMGENAFEGCSKLKEVYASKLVQGVDEAFNDCEYVEFKTPQQDYIIVDGERIKSQEELEQEKSGNALEEAVDTAYNARKEADEIVNGKSDGKITERDVNGLTVVSPTNHSIRDRITIAMHGYGGLRRKQETAAKEQIRKEMSQKEEGTTLQTIKKFILGRKKTRNAER